MQELKTKAAVRVDEATGKNVTFFLQSSFYSLSGSWQWDMATDAVFCSDVMFSLPDAFEGTRAIFHPDDVAPVKEALCSGCEITLLRFRIITTYGEVKTVVGENVAVVPEEQETGAWQQVLKAGEQEAEHKAAQIHLLLLKTLGEKGSRLTGTGTWYYNATTSQTWYSDAVFALHNLPPQSLNAHLHTFHVFIHPEDRETVVEFTGKAFREKAPLHIEYRIVAAGAEKWIAYKSLWFFTENGDEILGGTLQDITEEKTAEKETENFKALMQFLRQQLLYDEQQVAIGHWQVALLTRKTTYSDQYFRIFGVKPQSLAPTLLSFLNYLHPDDRARVEAAYKKIIHEHVAPDLEFRVIRADGKTRHILQKGKLLMFEEEMMVAGFIQDITVQRMLEKKVTTLHDRLQQKAWLLLQTDDAGNTVSWVMDLEENTVEWSESFYRLIGFLKTQPQNVTEKTLSSIVHPHDWKTFATQWQATLQQKEDTTFPCRCIIRGTVHYMRAIFSYRSLEEKGYFIGTLQDTTGEEVLQQQLSQRVQLAESLTENIHDRVLITDINNTILLWNKACEETYAVAKYEAIGQNFFDVFPHLKTEQDMQAVQKVQRGEKVVQEGVYSALGNGYYNLYLMPLYQEGEVMGVLHVISDVTKETELRNSLHDRLQLIESIVQSSVDRIIALDRHMNYLYWNKKAEEHYGLAKEKVVGRNILEVFPRLVNDPSYEELRKALRGETIHLPVDAERDNYFETYLVPIKGAGGEVTAVLWITHDLTSEWSLQQEQRKAQEQLQEEHRRLKEAQAIGHVGSFEWDAATDQIYWSDEMYRIHGLEPQSEAITLEKAFSFLHPAEPDVNKKLFHLRKEPNALDFTHRIIRADGEERMVRRQVQSFGGTGGGITHLTGTVQDITEQESAKHKLVANEALLRSAEEVAHTGSYEADIATMTFRFSNGLYRLFGEEPGGFDPSLESIDKRSHPDDVPVVKHILEQAAINKQPYHYTRRIFRKDGEMRTVEAHGKVATDAAGNAVKFIGLVQDVTERTIAEEEIRAKQELLQATMDSSMAIIQAFKSVRNERGEIVDFIWVLNNYAAEKLFGQVAGKSLLTLNPGVREEGIFDTFKKVVETGVPNVSERHYQHEQFNGWFYQSVVKLNDGVVTTTTDITEQKTAQQELRVTKEFLQATLDSSLYVVQAFQAIRNQEGHIIDFTWLYTNKKWEEKYGGNMPGKRLLQENPGVQESGLFQKFVAVTETGVPVEQEQYYVHEQFDGWFFQTLAKMGDGFVMTTVDVTERKKTEQEILRVKEELAQQATKKYHELFQSIDQGFCTVTVRYDEGNKPIDYQFLEVSPSFEHHTGIKEAAGKWMRDIVPDQDQFWFETYGRIAKTRKAERFEYLSTPLQRWFGVYAFPIDRPEDKRIAVLFDDITERKKREQQQDFLLRFSDTLRAEPNVDAVANRALQMLAEHLKLDRCYVGVYQIAEDRGVFPYQVGNDQVPPMPASVRLSDFPDALRVAFDRTLVIDDIAKAEGLTGTDKQNLGALRLCALVAATLRKGEANPLWSIVAVAANPRHWTLSEIKLMEEVTERTWAAIEKAKAEDALRQSEEKCRSLFNSIDEGFCLIDILYDETGKAVDYRFLEVNAVFEKQTGLHDVINKTRAEVAPGEEPHWVETYETVVRTGQGVRFESYHEQTRRWYDVYASPVAGENRRRVVTVFKDITERKKAEKSFQQFANRLEEEVVKRTGALRQSGEDLQKNMAILQQAESLAQMGSWEYDRTSGQFNWSDGMYRLFGLPQGTPVKPETYLEFAFEEDRPNAKRLVKNLKKGSGDFEEIIRIERDGGTRLLKIKGSVVPDERGKIEKVVGIDVDMTDMKEAEQKLAESKTLLEQTALASPDAINVYDLYKKQPVYLNNCLAQWLGKTTNELVRIGIEGRLKFIHPDDRLPLLQFNEKLKSAKDTAVLTLEYRLQAKGDRLLWVRNRSKVLQRDAAGNVTHVLSVLQDITEEKAAEEVMKNLNATLERKNTELESANEEITSFAFVASHDLKEPLRKIHTFSDFLITREENLSSSGRQALEKMNSSVKRLDQLINDILALTKVHVEKETLQPVDLNSVIQRLKDELNEMLETTGAVIEAEPLPLILGLENQLFYLFRNLVSNGLKFQPKERQPHLIISAGKDETFFKIAVRDNGIGIAPEYHKRIFEMFKRLHGRTEYEGTGMGLSICKKIMEKHGGKITVESEEGMGATFVCWFPVVLLSS